MSKKDTIKKLSEVLDKSQKETQEVFDAFDNFIFEEVCAGNEVPFSFGKFKKQHVAARKGRNPATGEEIDIEAKDKLVFKGGAKSKNI